MGLNVAALNDFNNEVSGRVIPKIIFEGYSTSILPIQEGIKYQEPLNLMEVDLQVQNGDCVSTPSGSLTATQRNITVTQRTSYDGLCLDQLNSKYLGISALSAGSYSETFALAETYTDMIVNQMKKSDDQFLWNTTNGLGLLTSGSTAGVVVPAGATGSFSSTTALAIIDSMIEAIPADIQDRQDFTVWMSTTNFRKYIVALRNANNYYFDMNAADVRTGVLQSVYPFAPGVKVVGTTGISGNRIALMPDAYAVIGTDLMSDETSFQLWYDINADQLKHRLKSKLGVQVAFPEYIVSNDKN